MVNPLSPQPLPPPVLLAGVGWALAPPRVDVVGWLPEGVAPWPFVRDIFDRVCYVVGKLISDNNKDVLMIWLRIIFADGSLLLVAVGE